MNVCIRSCTVHNLNCTSYMNGPNGNLIIPCTSYMNGLNRDLIIPQGLGQPCATLFD